MRSLPALLVLVASVSHAYEVKRDSTGAAVAWKSPLHLLIDAQLAQKLATPRALEAVRAAISTLGAAVPSLSLDSSVGTTHGVGYDFGHPSASTSDVTVPEAWEFDRDAVAITVVTINLKTHEIIEADVAFNAAHTSFAVVTPGERTSSYDVQNAMSHELGHALGLAHNPTFAQSLMYPHSAPGETSKRALVSDDTEGLAFLYRGAPAAPLTPEGSARGCSATGSAPFALLAFALLAVLRRRRTGWALATLLGALTFVAPVLAARASADAAWRVESIHAALPSSGFGILSSDVTFVRDGVVRTVKMPGGRVGDLEQVVDSVAVPFEGELRLLDFEAARPDANAR